MADKGRVLACDGLRSSQSNDRSSKEKEKLEGFAIVTTAAYTLVKKSKSEVKQRIN